MTIQILSSLSTCSRGIYQHQLHTANTGFRNETPEKAKMTNRSESATLWKGKKQGFPLIQRNLPKNNMWPTTVPFGIVSPEDICQSQLPDYVLYGLRFQNKMMQTLWISGRWVLLTTPCNILSATQVYKWDWKKLQLYSLWEVQ